MKYTFETQRNENGDFGITVQLSDGKFNQIRNTNEAVIFDFKNNDVNTVLKNMLNDIRLTVAEREEAEKDLKEFVNYLQYTNKPKKSEA